MKRDIELFTEILASDRLGAYQNFRALGSAFANLDPTTIWDHLFYNPWLAMAIYADMEEKDAAVYTGIDMRKNNVLSKRRNILPASESRRDRRIAEFVEETLRLYFDEFEAFLYESLDAIGKGVAIGEIIFRDAGDRVAIESVRFKPQHLFSFGETGIAGFSTQSMIYPQTGDLHLRSGIVVDGFPLGGPLPQEKFFVFSFRPRYGNRWGDPIHRKAYWPSWVKRSSVKEWLRYQEKGSGVVIARYNDGAAESEQLLARDAATAVQEESAVAMPKKFLLEVHEMVRNIGTSHKELVDEFCNSELSRIYLGQTLTSRGSDGGGSRALGEVHERVSDRITEADCRSLMRAVDNHLIRQIVRLNFGPDVPLPSWVIEYQPEDNLDAVAARYGVIRTQIGIELSKQQIRDDLGLQVPAGDDDRLELAPRSEPPALAGGQSDDRSDLAEPQKKNTLPPCFTPLISRTARFMRQRPSMIDFSNE